MTDRKLAQSVRVERDGNDARLFIDGVEFPYWLAIESIEIGPVHPDEVPRVRFTLLATRVEVVNADIGWKVGADEEPDGAQGKSGTA